MQVAHTGRFGRGRSGAASPLNSATIMRTNESKPAFTIPVPQRAICIGKIAPVFRNKIAARMDAIPFGGQPADMCFELVFVEFSALDEQPFEIVCSYLQTIVDKEGLLIIQTPAGPKKKHLESVQF